MRAAPVLVLFCLVGCEARLETGRRCEFTSECPSGLVCGVLGRCRAQCLTSRDCAVGERCLRDDAIGTSVCSLGEVDRCDVVTGCSGTLRCVESVCVNACARDTDCPDGRCDGTACEPIPAGSDAGPRPDAPSELDAGGETIDAAPPTGCTGPACVVDVSVGYGHACAVLGDGSLWCWGDASGPRLGDGIVDHPGCTGCSHTPVRVMRDATTPVDDAVAVACGDSFSCYVDADREVHCWGIGDEYQLGNDSAVPQPYAGTTVLGVDRTPLSGVNDLVVGRASACASAMGRAYCWGRNAQRQLSETAVDTLPVATPAVDGRTSIDLGCVASTYALFVDYLGGGRLGTGVAPRCEIGACALAPGTPVPGPVGSTKLACLDHAACELADGGAECWGGVGLLLGASEPVTCDTTSCATDPVPVADAPGVGPLLGLAGDWIGDAVCAWDVDGALVCWGSNFRRVIADSTDGGSPVGVRRAGVPPVVSASLGAATACAVTEAGELWCWGGNEYGQTGRGTVSDEEGAPMRVVLPPP